VIESNPRETGDRFAPIFWIVPLIMTGVFIFTGTGKVLACGLIMNPRRIFPKRAGFTEGQIQFTIAFTSGSSGPYILFNLGLCPFQAFCILPLSLVLMVVAENDLLFEP
jgi:hypothetical protein